jgi:hypothetical protein
VRLRPSVAVKPGSAGTTRRSQPLGGIPEILVRRIGLGVYDRVIVPRAATLGITLFLIRLSNRNGLKGSPGTLFAHFMLARTISPSASTAGASVCMYAAMWTAVVVLPLPPLKLATQIIIESLRHDALP